MDDDNVAYSDMSLMILEKEKDDRVRERNKNFKSSKTLIGCEVSTSPPGYAAIGQHSQSRVTAGNPHHHHQ